MTGGALPMPARRRTPETARVLPVVAPVAALAAVALGAAAYSLSSDVPSREMIAGSLALLAAAILTEAFPLPIEGVDVGRTSLASADFQSWSGLRGSRRHRIRQTSSEPME